MWIKSGSMRLFIHLFTVFIEEQRNDKSTLLFFMSAGPRISYPLVFVPCIKSFMQTERTNCQAIKRVMTDLSMELLAN